MHRLATLVAAAVATLSLAAPAAALAQEHATTKNAEALVHQAVAFMKKEGKEKALAAFSDPKGAFTYRDLYISAIDLNGVNVAHGVDKGRIGKNVLHDKDADGKEFVKERIELARKNGKGWQDYKYRNPVTGKVEQKVAYFEQVGDVILLCGAYRT